MPAAHSLGHPAFLVGAERSGTTVFRLMLSGHPELCWVNEFELAVDQVGAGGWPDLEDYYEFLSTHRIARAMGYEIDRSLAYPELVQSFLEQRRSKSGKPYVGATVHRNFHRLPRLWPQARYIHLVRDPRDVAPSCIAMGWSGNVWTAVERWLHAEQIWEDLARTLPEDRRLEVRYEALICEPERELRRTCAFLGVPFDPAMLDYPRHSTYSSPDPKLIEQWRKKLSSREVRLVESRVAHLLQARGFAPSGEPALSVGPLEVIGFRLQDRIARVRHRVRVFGLPLVAEEYASRLGSRSWHRSVRLRMNAIQQANLK